MKVGTAEADPGETATGYRTVTDLPVGGSERLPVTVLNGSDTGPTVWVTGTIHGDEPTGTEVIHDVTDRVDVDELAGTVVCLPVMNPAGFRTASRTSYYHGDDPNRYFGRAAADSAARPRVQQVICERVYDDISATADALMPLHTSWVATHPYTIQPRVPYGGNRSVSDAAVLRDRLVELAEAFGLPVVNQFPPSEIEAGNLQHSLTGAAVADGIPAFTPELGGRLVVERDVAAAAVDGVWNVLHALEMVDRPADRHPEFALDDDGRLRRFDGPHADVAGIVRYRVAEGEFVEAGDVVADVVDPHGAVKTDVAVERDGYVLSRREGAAVYENDVLLDMAVPDDTPLLMESE
ncbi:MAG: M14 family metallopeptidase [Halorubrum sp.]|uniref:succinylglutamate desuccinylase/aspartoacylase family protein n=1 Tax=Halorubrum sp. TaxID=1879286 RepID=UPI003970758F